MLPDFELIHFNFPGYDDVTIIPIADVHLGSPECMEQEFIQFIDSIKSKPNVYLILGGDLLDNGTKSGLTNPFRAVYPPSIQKKMMAEILKPCAERILCMVCGNHERRSGKDADDDPCYDIAAILGIENRYRENIAFLNIQMGKQHNDPGSRMAGHHRPSYNIVVTHGAGGGILTGGAVNRSERFGYVIDGMDALILGHTHKPYTTQPSKIQIDVRNDKVSFKPFKVISMTSWLSWGGYSAQKMLLPTSHCLQTITLCGNKKEMIVTM